jgi:cation diffusion facilitator CzcD-associated flavoprotein CzcO
MSLAGVELFLRAGTQTPQAIGRPAASAMDRAARAAYRRLLAARVHDPETRRALMPDFGLLVKRPTMSNHFLTAFNRENVDLVTEPIARVTPTGIETADGTMREVGVIVLATGYELFSDPESYRPGTVVGRDGFDLGRFYATEGMQAYESVAVPGLPNRWTLVGPYSWTGTGWHALVEINAQHISRAITAARRRRAHRVEVRPEAHQAFHAEVRRRGRLINWYFTTLNAGVRTYYRNSQGDVPYIRPSSVLEARRRSTRFPLDDYRFTVAEPAGAAPADRVAEAV